MPEIKISFTIDPNSYEGRLFELAVRHYTVDSVPTEFGLDASIVARRMVGAWLSELIHWPPLYLTPLGASDAPTKRVDVELTKID
jgi:hypothetical protein